MEEGKNCKNDYNVNYGADKVGMRKPTSLQARWRCGLVASGSEGPGFESWLCQVDVESLGKALYMHFPHPTHV